MDYILGHSIEAMVFLDSKDDGKSLSTQRNSVDHLECSDVNHIQFLFETKLCVMRLLCSPCNMANMGTKPNSLLTDAVMLMFTDAKIPIDLLLCDTKASVRQFGNIAGLYDIHQRIIHRTI